jgi:L-threonylcarbamoyladenylate synthase
MPISSANIRPADEAGIKEAAACIAGGGLVAFPTETVYGLGADARSGDAVARIFDAKDRPQFNPLIVHLATTKTAERQGVIEGMAKSLAAAFWPGPLTIVVSRKPASNINPLVSAGGDTLALRVPGHPVAQALLQHAGCPVAAPSANRSGRISPTTAAHVAESLGDRVDIILDGGACPGGLESTIIDVSGGAAVLLRPGLIGREDIAAVVGDVSDPADPREIQAPGMLPSHYAPHAAVRLNATEPRLGEALLGFGPDFSDNGAMMRNLSPAGNLREAAANLFSMLHDLDLLSVNGIAVAPIPETGLGVPINDRLRRAAAPRD